MRGWGFSDCAAPGPAARVCAPSGLFPREPPLLRGGTVEGPIQFYLTGRGVSLPGPHPQAISPRYGGWDGAGGGRNRGRHPWAGFSGDIATTAPFLWGRGRSAGGAGGVGERGERCRARCRRNAQSGLPPPGRAPPRLLPREPPLLRGSLIGGPVWFSLPGRGFPPRAPPRAISPRSGVRNGAGGGQDRGRHPGPAFPGISRLLPPPTGAGEERRRRGWGGGKRRAVQGEMPAKGALGAGSPCGSFQGYRLYWLRPSHRRIYRIGSRQIRIGIIEYFLE